MEGHILESLLRTVPAAHVVEVDEAHTAPLYQGRARAGWRISMVGAFLHERNERSRFLILADVHVNFLRVLLVVGPCRLYVGRAEGGHKVVEQFVVRSPQATGHDQRPDRNAGVANAGIPTTNVRRLLNRALFLRRRHAEFTCWPGRRLSSPICHLTSSYPKTRSAFY